MAVYHPPSPGGGGARFYDRIGSSSLSSPRWYCRYVEMFLGPLEGISSLRTHFWPVSRPQLKWTFSAQIVSLAQYWDSERIWGGNSHSTWGLETSQKYVLRLKIPSRDPKNISKYLQDHLRPLRSSLKKSWKITSGGHFPFCRAQRAKIRQFGASHAFRGRLWVWKVDKISKQC